MDAEELEDTEVKTPKGPPADIETRTVQRDEAPARESVSADLCVLGAGMSGVSTAITAARNDLDVVLIDAAPSVGGSAVNSIVGSIAGLHEHNEAPPEQLTHGVADELTEEMIAEGSMVRHYSEYLETTTYAYEEVRLGRWMERKIEEEGIDTLLGSVLEDVAFEDRRVRHIDCVNRFGPVRIEADGWVDASGDAVLTWESGLEVREPVAPIYGTLSFTIENYDPEAVSEGVVTDVRERLSEVREEYDLDRGEGALVHQENAEFLTVNFNHIETPLEPFGFGQMVFEGRRKADNFVTFLREEFPEIFGDVRVRAYGDPGIRQTRWIKSREQFTLEDIRTGRRHDDAIGRGAWWVELHDSIDELHVEHWEPGHVYYIPLSCMIPEGAENLIAVGRCVDGDSRALSAIRVMGPCIAMGTAAAHVFDLVGTDPVYEVDMDRLQERLAANLGDRA